MYEKFGVKEQMGCLLLMMKRNLDDTSAIVPLATLRAELPTIGSAPREPHWRLSGGVTGLTTQCSIGSVDQTMSGLPEKGLRSCPLVHSIKHPTASITNFIVARPTKRSAL